MLVYELSLDLLLLLLGDSLPGKEMAGFYRQTHGKEIRAGIPDFEPVIRLLLPCVTEIASCEITFLIHEMSRKVPLLTVGLSPSQ